MPSPAMSHPLGMLHAMTHSTIRRILEVSGGRDGLLTRADLSDLEITKRQLQRLRGAGVVRLVTPNVFVVGTAQLTWARSLRVGLAEAGPTAALGFGAGLAWWEAPRIGQGAVEVVVPRWARVPSRTIGRVHRSRDLPPSVVTNHQGLPVTTPARTVLDMATRLGPSVLDEIVQDLCRRQLVTIAELHEHLATWRRPGRHGVRRMADLLDGLDELADTESWLEARFLRLLDEHGLPRPRTQVEIEVEGHRYRVDTLWDDVGLIVELNGYATHGTRAETSYDAERATLLGSLGYEVVTFTHDQVVGRPRYVVAQVGRRLVGPRRPHRAT